MVFIYCWFCLGDLPQRKSANWKLASLKWRRNSRTKEHRTSCCPRSAGGSTCRRSKCSQNWPPSAWNSRGWRNKDLKAKNQELEGQARLKTMKRIEALESKISALQDQLDMSAKDQAVMAKTNRKLERKCKEGMQQVEEERRHADQYKEQRSVDEAEEENTRLATAKRRIQRELDDVTEANEELTREVQSLRNRLRGRGGGGPSGRSGYTTPPEPRRKTTRGDRSGDAGEGDASLDADAEV
ncbi:Myosin heavy chain [Acropora cervicornis]|uniref:Myosin heavy chain n=1 Tax=Acropora cervicornis TaxID=6130 RepID=A0AAD9R2L9_ACRCE|nr:Myosin heavy chain [Acropora cervicornis]